MTTVELFERLGLALAIGLLMGIERGWEVREEPEGSRVAGIRTFALIGLSGGVWGILASQLGPLVLAAGFLALAALVVVSYGAHERPGANIGITTAVAELAAFALAALAALGDMAPAAAASVVATALLNAKETLHGWLSHLERLELRAAIRLLLISVVLLPVLPNKEYGPYGGLNPYTLWLLVVMVATISFVGYFAIKIAGPRIGSLLTGVFGGLASSTALTVSFARMGRESPGMQGSLAAGVAVANATMYGRLWTIVTLLNAPLGLRLLPPLAAMMATGLLSAYVLWRMRAEDERPGATRLINPFEVGVAAKFALFLGLVLIASKTLQVWVGAAGLYLLAAVAGLADVDAISLSMAEMGGTRASLTVAATAVTIAAFVNTGVKAALVGVLCGGAMARRTTMVVLAVIASGAFGLLLPIVMTE
ncbi:MAG: DUF4010 domain-containing protein [Magnetospirillum sp.]|nr:DUF4010 domain-containing protein [Magnetospirillum sp.]